MVVQWKEPEEAEKRTVMSLPRWAWEIKRMNIPSRLSGGQQQRVAIARAMAMHPDSFDGEPTSALDPEMVKEVLDVIRDLAKSGITSGAGDSMNGLLPGCV